MSLLVFLIKTLYFQLLNYGFISLLVEGGSYKKSLRSILPLPTMHSKQIWIKGYVLSISTHINQILEGDAEGLP